MHINDNILLYKLGCVYGVCIIILLCSTNETLTQCWFNIMLPSTRWHNIKPSLGQRLLLYIIIIIINIRWR